MFGKTIQFAGALGAAVLAASAWAALAAPAEMLPDLDVGWRRVKTVFASQATKNIYACPVADCEPLSSYSNGLLVARLASVYAAAWDLSGAERYRIALDEVLDEALDGSEGLAKMSADDLRPCVPDYALLQMSSSLEVLRGTVKGAECARRIDALLQVVARLAARRDAEGEECSPWLCGVAERPLVQLMAPGFAFDAAAKARLSSRCRKSRSRRRIRRASSSSPPRTGGIAVSSLRMSTWTATGSSASKRGKPLPRFLRRKNREHAIRCVAGRLWPSAGLTI